MSSKSVKFEISLEKLTVKFEGDIQFAERVQGEITGALNTLASAQQRMLAGPSPANIPVVELVPPARRGRRRRRGGSGTPGIDPGVLDGLNGSDSNGAGDGVEADGGRRTVRGGGPSSLIHELKSSGFFGTKRTIGAIRDALAMKGHTLKSNQISPTLVSLTRESVLKREKNPQKQWIYFAD